MAIRSFKAVLPHIATIPFMVGVAGGFALGGVALVFGA